MPMILEQGLLYLRYATRRRWTVLVFAWLFCLVGWAVVVMTPNLYQSEARIYADTNSLLTPLVTGLAPERETASRLDVLEEILLSHANLLTVAERAGLAANPPAATVSHLRSAIKISPEGGSLFTIAYVNRDPSLAHAVVAGLLDTTLRDELEIDRKDSDSAQNFLQQQLDLKSKQLREAESALAAFQRRNVDILAGQAEYLRNLDGVRQRKDEIDADINALKARRQQLALRINELPATVSPLGLGDSTLREGSPGGQLSDLTQRLGELRSRFTNKHPDVIATRRAIKSLRDQIENGASAQLPGISNPLRIDLQLQMVEIEAEIASLEKRGEQAATNVARLSARATELPEAQAELKRLTGTYELHRQQHDDLQQRRESARIVGDLGGRSEFIDFRIVDPANRPMSPASPARFAMMLTILAVGLATGLAIAVGAGIIQNPFESGRTLREVYGLQVLGTVSRIIPPCRRSRHRLVNVSFGAGCAALIFLLVVIIMAENRRLFAPLRQEVAQTSDKARVA